MLLPDRTPSPRQLPDPALPATSRPVACSNCQLRELCLPVGLSKQELARLEALVSTRRSLRRGERLFRSGDAFEALYAVRTGFFKTQVSQEDGHDQVTGFQMAGELLGLDGIGNGLHRCDATALEDSQVCVIPFGQLEKLAREFGELQHRLHRIMGCEIARDQEVMLLLGGRRAEQRLARFLLDLMQRLEARGFSSSSLVLRMTREEIGSYLGMKLETVSRCLSRFQQEGVLAVRQRQVRLLERDRLQALAGGSER